MDLGQDGSVKEIMPADEWNNITVEDINKGIVIVDNAITYDGGNPSGTTPDFNEYVWVPIPDSNNFKRTAWTTPYGYDANGSWESGGRKHLLAETSTTNYWWEDKTTTEYTNMVDSVEHYKGFYIGRYEASDNGSDIAQSKRNISPWIDVSQTTAITACTNNTKTPNMHLIYGIEWDSTLNWLKDNATISSSNQGATKTMELADIQTDSRSWGNYNNSTGDAEANSGSKQNTGYSEYWKANNIYDLAGNVYEWTQEKYSTGADGASRGGNYGNGGDNNLVASRYHNPEGTTNRYLRVP